MLEGTNIVENEPPAQSLVRLGPEKYKSQMEISPGAGSHYIGVNNKVGPFSNINLRKAFWAALDRTAMDKARGGELVTNVATHFIYPDDQRLRTGRRPGGSEGRLQRTPRRRHGDRRKVHKARRLPERQVHRRPDDHDRRLQRSPPAKEDAEIVNQTLKNLGFNTKFTLVEQSTMYAKYCNVPKEEIDVCPSVGWIADFADPQTVLNITFNGNRSPPRATSTGGRPTCRKSTKR